MSYLLSLFIITIQCTQECGGGRRQRSITCVDSKTNEELSSSKCNALKPSENEPCNLQDYAQSCTQNQTRLFSGSSSSNGVLQVCNSSRVWTDVCDYYWNNNAHSVVVCKQLGFTSPTPITVFNAGPASTGKFTYVSTSSYCSISSSVITSCLSTSSWLLQYSSCCSISRDTVYIDCNPDTANASVGQARLYNVRNKHESTEGMLQIGDAGRNWTAVCDYGWSCNHAVTACKQLGYSNPSPNYRVNAGPWIKFGYGPYSYCSSSATNLNSCSSYSSSYRTNPSYCDTNRDTVYLKCNVQLTCSPNYSVRLVGGKDSSEGRVEVCYNGIWHALCGTYIDQYFASVVCNQLGFTISNFSTTIADGRYGYGNTSSYFPGSIYCFRLRNNISSCYYYGSFSSSKCMTQCSSYYIGIKCISSGDNCNEGEVRLVNGTEEREGRLEVCANGVWGTVCSYSFTRAAAYIACKQLGYNDSNDAIIDTNAYDKFGGGDKPIVYSYVDCFGLETRLSQCDKSVFPTFSCYYGSIVGLKCLDICNEGKIRLVGGKNSLEGTVEICIEKRWKLISESGWDDTDASVVCRQLNHTGGEAVLNSLFGEPKRAIVYSNVNCRGTETELRNCTHNRLYPERVDGD
uniref:SRCR domain-containing protein n=1 Tax=Amphimedon queenslandica TaxID=400682 RepID=A0A1X7TXL8_AMPQE